MKKHLYMMAVLSIWAPLMSLAVAQDDYALIVGKGVEVSEVSANDLRKIYLGMMKEWPDSKKPIKVFYVDPENSPLTSSFLENVVRKDQKGYEKYWIKKVFHGFADIPVKVDSEEALIQEVGNTPGSIGFISKPTLESKQGAAESWRGISIQP